MALAKHILVATDFSDGAADAVRAGADLAAAAGAKVTLFHAIDPDPLVPPGAIPNPAGFREKIVAELEGVVRKNLDEIAAKHYGEVGDVDQIVAQAASAPHAICQAAEEIGADLIVIATHGRTGLAHMLIGSVAERVVRHAPCAVLTVRAQPLDD